MTAKGFVIFASERSWQCATIQDDIVVQCEIPLTDDPSVHSSIGALHMAMKELGYMGQGCLLALPSSWCLSATIDGDGNDRHSSRSSKRLLYRLEEQLPVPAEGLVADFTAATDDHLLGVAVEPRRLTSLLESLESEGIAVNIICPTALLAIQNGATTSAFSTFAWWNGETFDIFRLDHSRLQSWTTVSCDGQRLLQELRLQALHSTNGCEIVIAGSSEGLAQIQPDVILRQIELTQIDAATREASAVLANQHQPLVNLRRDQLAMSDPLRQVRGPAMCAMAVAIVCLVVIGAAVLWRAHKYRVLAAEFELQQTEVFKRVIPSKPLPIDAALLLQSEERRLSTLTGSGTSLPAPVSALWLLRELFAGLPHNLRFRILELQLDGQRLQLEGQARNHSDAETVAAALRQTGTFDPEAPHSEQLGASAQGVSFSLAAAVRSSPHKGNGTDNP